MTPDNAVDEVHKRLQDTNIRIAYGAEVIKLDLAEVLTEAYKQYDASLLHIRYLLAEWLEVKESYITRLERGEANPNIETIGKIFGAMGLRIKFLIEPLDR